MLYRAPIPLRWRCTTRQTESWHASALISASGSFHLFPIVEGPDLYHILWVCKKVVLLLSVNFQVWRCYYQWVEHLVRPVIGCRSMLCYVVCPFACSHQSCQIDRPYVIWAGTTTSGYSLVYVHLRKTQQSLSRSPMVTWSIPQK